MPECTRRIEFDAGHRVLRHESKCRHVHGHRFRGDITVASEHLDTLGRVVDFGVVKDKVGTWIDDSMDHGYLMHPEDPMGKGIRDVGLKVYEMPHDHPNPTAENLAVTIARQAATLLEPHGVIVTHVRVYETPNCWADWRM